VSSDTTSPSDENRVSGLWLWHGKAPPPLPPLQPASRVEQIPGLTSLLCEGVDGWRCLAGWRLHCLRSCCARRLWTSRRRWIRPLWRSKPSRRPPRRTRSSRLLPSTSPHLGSSRRTPRSIRRKCRPRRLPQGQSTNWRKGDARRISANREKNPRIRWQKLTIRHPRGAHASGADGFRAIAVTEPLQQDENRPDERARPRMFDRAALSLRPSIAWRQGAFVARGRRARPSAAVPSAGPGSRLKGARL
jgi:hypothetical protein